MLFALPGAEPVPGLRHLHSHIDPGKQEDLLHSIDGLPWRMDLKRRVQHYGYRYDYRRRTVDSDSRTTPLPDWARELAARFRHEGLAPAVFNQLIVNEYLPGQGISPHVDCRPCFDATILSVSLGSPCMFVMRHTDTAETREILLEPGDVLVMTGEARYDWQHGIPPRKTDRIAGRRISRGRRVSLTFRRVAGGLPDG
ncbi:alpha-ketoglutarate-dependent dioxygenase AlkB [Streptomyces sp. DH37]|uniref:alpha-ketoglutarate-dependent dioxygenase AlkB n=1 Tax=Streptomyces sp. DH37 TaxID=3040122 RepID=UPI0024436FE7|nr:alpha-ketoglutarate-dependent dioxygenase AlkB [Streptomyces sp. DH37]MDG9700679.1 alpha-ketoglutarate-dependent dioxygenase AlkB [Streptomyces sp. DH37]